MSAKIAKTIARQKEKIAEGSFYEAHQQLRVITARYLKASDYNSACDVLYNGALLLLRADQGGSGGDLALMLLNDVYVKGEYACDDENRKRLLEIFHAFPKEEPTRKRFVSEMVNWSGKFGDLERGDPEIHHQVGKVLAEEGEAYDAERHLVIGTPASPPVLASLHYIWYKLDQPHLAPIYASRSVLPYLLVGNLSSANLALSAFTSHLTTQNPNLLSMSQPLESAKSGLSLRIFPSIPLLNFLSLLLLSCQKADASLFRQLAKFYATHLKEVEGLWGEALANIGEIWFGIKIPRQTAGNPLFDMMGSMLFGGQQPGGRAATPRSGTPKPAGGGSAAARKEIEKPPTMDLD
ncbi:uncharacterized protein A1O5_00098 [Cladophialophora psammophila CBS 110553]|uniref:DUF410 domain-containing protein n=1 Tax=Cladophialophora psammophila CBS 110553 TaxID=1182543 RepID=W9XF57_9EURO|nr:uncharacterized protein A1O5_00098 [Cladophialophora psammophila CBS 110553]EXJ75591.1 hypothetical protein A1O5_00098 [Cladophialophora psammophila CBS 110553]